MDFNNSFGTITSSSPMAKISCSLTLGSNGLMWSSILLFFLALVASIGQLTLLHILLNTGGSIPAEVKTLFINATLGWALRYI